ncbi:uncharacterized protein LOC125207873 [Salvia hispanica]|uniref:uncharacterized protein LOC125207873 n=1 Tax=Salvia hispanica TaxID=49212 RepID=UPI00200974C5|nr:uncharacterized protein LOC125207873 [Salvia hispanica]
MSSKPITRNGKPLIKSTIHKTMKFLTKSFTHLKPTKSPANANTNTNTNNSDDCYTIFSETNPNSSPNPISNPIKTVTKKKIEDRSETAVKEKHTVKEEAAKWRWSGADVLAQKMIDLEMTDSSDIDQAVDVEEVLHYYSRLTCPAYVEIVDDFLMDMYSEFQVSGRRSLNSSMRKLAPETNYSSMRSLAPLKL